MTTVRNIHPLHIVIVFLVLMFMASDSVKSQSEETQTQLILLGTGTPNADPERSGPSLAIVVGSNSYIVDFGPGVVRRASALSKQWGGKIEALNANNLKLAFLTHLHSDHTAGYADLILTPWVLGRNIPLEVYGPKGLTQMTEDLLEAYRSDISYRLDGLEPANALGWQVNTHEITEGVVFQDDLIEVTAFKINHGSWDNAFGYRFVTTDKTIVISGDTSRSQNLIRYSE